MRKIYIDKNYKCHIENGKNLREIETNYFDGKCDTYIEGYRFIPKGETWKREDGATFTGEMTTPWMDHSKLDEAQREYELQQIKEMTTTIAELDEALLDATYNNIVGGK